MGIAPLKDKLYTNVGIMTRDMRILHAEYGEPQQGLEGSQRSFFHLPAPWQNGLYLSFSWQVYVQPVLRAALLMGV